MGSIVDPETECIIQSAWRDQSLPSSSKATRASTRILEDYVIIRYVRDRGLCWLE